MADNISFYNPTDIGYFDLGQTQIEKVLPFKSVEGVFSPTSFVKFYLKNTHNNKLSLFNEFTIGAGLNIVGDNVQGTEKTLSLMISGSDFEELPEGANLIAECSFFIEGDIEITFQLGIK